MHKYNVIFDKTVTEIVTMLTKCIFPYLNPTNYLKIKDTSQLINGIFNALQKLLKYFNGTAISTSFLSDLLSS